MGDLAGALVGITFFLSVAGVIILRPLSKRLGEFLLEMRLERRGSRLEDSELARIRSLLERMNGRLDLMEDRLDFTERLLSSGERRGRAGDRLALTDEER
jgi:hypothetical protein